MDYNYQRRLEINEWIITTRWFYMVAVFLIGILGNSLFSLFDAKFSFFSITFLLLIFLLINGYLQKVIFDIKKNKSTQRLKYLGVWQIIIELAIFTVVMQLLGDKLSASLFFFLPIISASIIFGIKGAVFTAMAAALIVNGMVIMEYFDFLISYFLKEKNFSILELSELRYTTFNLIKIIITSNFYFVIALISGYTSKLFFKREQKLISRMQTLVQAEDNWEEEKRTIGKNAQRLEKRESIISTVNNQLNLKIKELETSEKSLMRAFSDLKIARKNIEDERNKTAAIITNFIDPIIVINQHNCLDLLNPAARNIFGFVDDDLGREISIMNNYSMNNFKKIIKQEFSVKTSKELKSDNPNEEEVVINPGGQELTYKVITARVVDNNNKEIGVMKIFYNLTREKMIDKLKSEFISIAAHQLRTPLSAIKWVVKMILDGDAGKLNKEQQELLFKGYQSNERIISLVNDMLNVSRIEEGRYGYKFKKENFIESLDAVIGVLEANIKHKSIELEVVKPKKPIFVYMDSQKMGLVLQNLIENAVKYTPDHGKIKISLETGNLFLKVKIKDNGVGIPKEDQSKLFSKFFRATNVVRMQTEGSGLGLFIVKNIIKEHGGKISFNSKEGEGTEFIFTIPLKTDES